MVLSGRARIFLDNASLTRMALQEAAAGIERADDLPRVELADESIVPRAYALAKSYLEAAAYRFDLAGFRDYVAEVQFASPIEMAEAWHLKPFLNFAIVEQIAAVCGPLPSKPQEDAEVVNAVNASADSPRLRDLVDSLLTISDLEWKTVFCEIDLSEKILRQDRAGTYARMDFASREAYRAAVAELAKGSKRPEHEIATQAIESGARGERDGEFERQGAGTALARWLLSCGSGPRRAGAGDWVQGVGGVASAGIPAEVS